MKTAEHVGGANVYVRTDVGRRGWLRIDLVAFWREMSLAELKARQRRIAEDFDRRAATPRG